MITPFDNGTEVSQGADWRQSWSAGGPDESAQRAEEQGGFDSFQRNAILMEVTGSH